MKYPVFFAVLLLPLATGCNRNISPAPASATHSDGAVVFSNETLAANLNDFQHETGASGKKWFPETMGSGGGFLDINSDGWLDIVLVSGGSLVAGEFEGDALVAYVNDGVGSFVPSTDRFPTEITEYGMGITAADYDNDGDEDIFFTTVGQNYLLRNDDGVFVDVSISSGIDSSESWSTAAIFFDADRDGWLDLFVGNYVEWSPETDLFCSLDGQEKGYCTPELYRGVSGIYYHNDGDGTFTDKTTEAGLSQIPGKTLGISELDYNKDGWPDLAIANDSDPDQLFTNNGDGTFTEIGVSSGIGFDERGRARNGMGIDAGVVDSTGEETIFVGNFSNQMVGIYRHMGGDVFLDRAASSGIGRGSLPTLTFGLALSDFDLDGDLDLFVANGHVQPLVEKINDNISFRQPSQLFLNNGDGTFREQERGVNTIFADSLVARGLAFGDYDHDGDVDLLITQNGGDVRLWQNRTEGVNWLRVRLTSTARPAEGAGLANNREGIGSTISLYANGTVQYRRVRTGSSYLSQSEKVATFGLGQTSVIDSVVVDWAGGERTVTTDLDVNQEIRLSPDGIR